MTEKRLQEKIVKEFKRHGILVYKFEAPGNAGVPDLICIAPGGRVFFMELKHPGGTGRLSALQAHTIEEMTAAGAHVHVCNSLDHARTIAGIPPHP